LETLCLGYYELKQHKPWFDEGCSKTIRSKETSQIEKKLNSGNACYHSVQNLLSSRLLPKNVKIKIYKTLLTVVLHEREPWSLILRDEHRLRASERRVLRRIFGPTGDEIKKLEKIAQRAVS
jgi:hypothetical protein